MRRRITVALIVGTSLFGCGQPNRNDTIEYQGHAVQLSKSYGDYDDYKDDPDNVAAAERARVVKLVSEAPVAKTFATREEMHRVIFDVKFPGYGSSSGGTKQADGRTLMLYSVEIPFAGQNRIFVTRELDGRCEVLDDFIASDELGIGQVFLNGDKLEYRHNNNTLLLTRPYKAN